MLLLTARHPSQRGSLHPLLRVTFCLLLACTASYHTASATTKGGASSASGGLAFVQHSFARKSAEFPSGSCDLLRRAANIFTLRSTHPYRCRLPPLDCSAASNASAGVHDDLPHRNSFSERRRVSRQIASSVLGLAVAASSPAVSAGEEGPPPKTGRTRSVLLPGYSYDKIMRFEEDTLMEDTGGILFKEVPFKPDVSFPAWMEGEWEVKAKIAEVTLPVEKFAPADAAFVADTPWSPLGPRLFPSEQDKGREVSYRLRFSRTWAGVQQDWRANYQAIINAYNAAPLLAAQDVLQQERRNESPEYKVVARSWLSDAESRGGSVRLRQVRSFGTDRCSRCRSHASWQFLDLSVNTADGAELLNRRIELITSLRLAGSNSGFLGLDKPRAAPDDKVLAKQRLALYLQEGDPQYTMSRTYAVALIDMELEMERVDSGGSAAAAAAERSANCDNGCDA